MSFGDYNTRNSANANVPQVAANYFVTINQLSARAAAPNQKEETTTSEWTKELPILAPYAHYLIYAPIVLFIILFIAAMIIQINQKIKGAHQMITAVVIALFAASIPTALTYMQTDLHQFAKAGPEEIPRNILVLPDTKTSALVTWTTDAIQIGSVRISPMPFSLEKSKTFVGNNQKPTKEHVVKLTGLTVKTAYEFEILSGTTWYDNAGHYIQFTFQDTLH